MATQKTFRMTPQRQVILEELTKARWHPTADELYMVVRQRLPRISLGTVYRNLEMLAEQGIIQQLETGGAQKRFDGTAEEHYHIRCLGCGRVDDIQLRQDLDLTDQIGDLGGYHVSGFLLEFIGYCPRCREQQTKEVLDGRRERNAN